MIIDFRERLRNDGDEEVERDDGGEDRIRYEQDRGVVRADRSEIVVEFAQGDEVSVLHAPDQPIVPVILQELVVLHVRLVHHLVAVPEGQYRHQQDQYEIAHFVDDGDDGADQEARIVENT